MQKFGDKHVAKKVLSKTGQKKMIAFCETYVGLICHRHEQKRKK